jgi:hypothetical protein
LVAKHEDLGILCRSIRPEDRNGLESAPEQTVEQGQGHQGSLAERVSTGQTRLGGLWTFKLHATWSPWLRGLRQAPG